MRNKYLILLLVFMSSYTYAQNIGIGTATPLTKLSVNGALSLLPYSTPAAALITIPNNISVFRLTNLAGTQANVLSVVTGYEGQYLTIYNEDNNLATFAGKSIAASGGVSTFIYLSGAWRQLSSLPMSGTLDNAYDFGGAGLGRIITADAGSVLIQGIDGFQSTGTFGSGATLGLTGAGTRMFWYPKKAAFRAGYASLSGWDHSNIGDYSIAMGYATTASSPFSTAIGNGTVANGWYSTAMGRTTTASGAISTAMGMNTSASGDRSTAAGYATTASGVFSTAIGYGTTASGENSTAMGGQTTASGINSTAMGGFTTASGANSTAIGEQTTASGDFSSAIGTNVFASSYVECVIGRYNTLATLPNATAWIGTDRLFSIGNGTTVNATSNALTILKNGRLGLQSVTSPTYALELPNNATIGVGQGRANAWVTYSDKRIKSNIAPIEYGIETILALSPKTYFQHNSQITNNVLEVSKEGKKNIGFIAQELYKICPEAVVQPENENTELWSVDYTRIIPILVKAMQEQQIQIEKQNIEIIELKELIIKNNIAREK